MADDIRSRAGLPPGEEAARRRRDGEARRAAAREALTQDQMRERTMREMEERRARPAPSAPERPMNPRPDTRPRIPASTMGTVARGASRAIPGVNVMRAMAPTSLEAGAEFEREGLARARAERMAGERAAMDQQMGEAPQRMPMPRPAAAPARRAAPAAREISADRLNDLMMGAEPATAEERIAQMRMRGRQRELEDRGSAFKKGGMVKPKAAPKKMMKGGMVAKPKAAAKAKAKPMPAFKKGGMIKKGKK